MQLKDHRNEGLTFNNRAVIAALLVMVILVLLVARMTDLQINQNEHFKTLSKDNRVKLTPLPPTRGLIYDRNGILLAQNRPAYSLEIIPEQVKDLDETLKQIAQVLPISEDDRERFLRLKSRKRRFDSVPIRTNLSLEEAAAFAVVRHQLPGVDVKAQLLRHYPYNEATAHLLGYVGRISKRDLEQIEGSNYAGTSHIGKSGLEKSYEAVLHGAVGTQQVEVNSVGRLARVLSHEPPTPGQNLHLHLDIHLQQTALDALEDYNGAIVAMDVRNGGLLALASKPGFDPNLFVEGISSRAYKALQADPNQPLYHRALRGQYPPGSTIKGLIGLAGLETGQIAFDTSMFCPGFYSLPNHSHRYRDWKKTGHGHMDLNGAIEQSCDVFYYRLAVDMGVDQLSGYLSQFGFGEPTGIDLIGEKSGILPSREWKRTRRNQPWYPGETVIMGIGQGYWLTTPLQLAASTAAFANGGTFVQPRLVDFMQTRGADEQVPIPPHSHTIPVNNPAHWDDVKQGMLSVTEGRKGTARKIRTDHYRIAGKTGTAQVFSVKQDEEYDEEGLARKLRDHALFVAYAPADDPQIAVAVIVENGGHGGAVAAPMARKVLDAWLLPRLAQTNDSTDSDQTADHSEDSDT